MKTKPPAAGSPGPNPDDDGGKRGRPAKLTPDLLLTVLKALRAGDTRKNAAKIAGIGDRTFKLWMANGTRYPDGIYADFLHAVLEAEGQYTADLVRSVYAEALADGYLALEVLGRRDPDNWGRYRGELGQIKKLQRENYERASRIERMLKEMGDGLAGAPDAPGVSA